MKAQRNSAQLKETYRAISFADLWAGITLGQVYRWRKTENLPGIWRVDAGYESLWQLRGRASTSAYRHGEQCACSQWEESSNGWSFRGDQRAAWRILSGGGQRSGC